MDKRKSERVSVRLPVIFRLKDKEEDFPLSSTLDINAAGLCLHTTRKFDISQKMSISVRIPPEDTIDIEVEVIWVSLTARGNKKSYHTGVTLLDKDTPEAARFVVFYEGELKQAFRKPN